MISYPKWLYHKNEAPKIVKTKEEHEALGEGWHETPIAIDQEPNETPKEPTADQASSEETEDSKQIGSMTVAELKAALISAGAPEEDIKGLKKEELIAKLGAM